MSKKNKIKIFDMPLLILLVLFFLPFTPIFAQPVNDHCNEAITLNTENGGCFFNATLINATQSLPAANCNSTLVQDVWFSFIADSSFHQVSVNPSSGMDAVVEVREGPSCEGRFLACIDQGGGDGAVENLPLNNLEKGSTYFIRVYDFTGVGSKPATWTLDICVSGFEPNEPPSIELLHPNGGENLEAGSALSIETKVTGVISGKELAFSSDNGANWETIWQSSSPNPNFTYDWFVPSINSNQCLIKATVFQSGEAFSAVSNTNFTISTSPNPTFQLSQNVSHLYWPFYNPSIFPSGDFHVPSQWQNQEEGVLITADDVVNTWFFLNSHYWQNSGRWHHSGDNCFAQDWNFINGGNSDCGMYFFSPMDGKILYKKDECLNFNCDNPTCTSGCGNFMVVQSTDDPSFAFRACHFSELNEEILVGEAIKAGDWLARIGNEGSSSAAHVHFVLYKNLTSTDIEILANGGTLKSNTDPSIDPANLTDLCYDKAANFRFDVSLDNPITHIPPVFYEPIYDLKLFPNPNSGDFKLSLNQGAQHHFTIEIYDSVGRLVFQKKLAQYHKADLIPINLNQPTAGLYIVKVRFDQEVLMKKFIVRNY